MYKALLIRLGFVLLAAIAVAAHAASNTDEQATAALTKLYAEAPATRALAEKAKAIIVFPEIYRAALLVGGQGGNGAMFKDGKIVGHYNIAGAAVGFEGGAQTYSYALFLMTDDAVERLARLEGYEIGVEPNIVVVNAGAATNLSTTTAQRDVYAYVFDTHGLMAGISLQGLKITRLTR